MIKGANRRIVIMKNTGSEFFEEAFFLVKENKLKNKNESVIEAKKIIERLEEGQSKKSFFTPLRLFVSGCLMGLALGFWL